jgi:hypothetical protein
MADDRGTLLHPRGLHPRLLWQLLRLGGIQAKRCGQPGGRPRPRIASPALLQVPQRSHADLGQVGELLLGQPSRPPVSTKRHTKPHATPAAPALSAHPLPSVPPR